MDVAASMKRTAFAFLLLIIVALYGCEQGRRPFLVVQICLGDQEGVNKFKELLQSIARMEGMAYIDGSAQTKSELEAIRGSDVDYPVINIAVERKDGMGLTAGDLTEPGYQVAVGFSEGSNPAEAHEFADRVVAKFNERWRVEVVPPGQGAHPLPDCSADQQ